MREDPASRIDDGSDEKALYLFAFGVGSRLRELPATLAEQVEIHHIGDIAALVGSTSIRDYCGADAANRLTDLAWLTPRLRRHAEVIDAAMRLSPVFPTPFGTLYSSASSLARFVDAHHRTILEFLRATFEHEEWELRAEARFDTPQALDQLACEAWPEWRTLPKGARYLRLCRDRAALLDFGRVSLHTHVEELLTELGPSAADVRRRDIEHRADSGHAEFISRYALLVPKPKSAEARARIAAFAERRSDSHLTIDIVGPAPPFSFRPNLDSIQ